MARTDSKEKRAVGEKTLDKILNIPGVVGEPIWGELADEAEAYLELYRYLSKEPLDSQDREALEDKMILSLAHLATHSQVLYIAVDKAIEANLPEEVQLHPYTLDASAPETDKGLLDYLNDISETQKRIVDFLTKLAKHSQVIKEQFVNSATETKRIGKSNDIKANLAKLNIASSKLAAHINDYSKQIQHGLPTLREDVSLFASSCSALISWETDSKEAQSLRSAQYLLSLQGLKASIAKLGTIEELMTVMRNAQHNKRLPANLRKACGMLEGRLLVLLDTFKELDAFTDEELAKLK